MKILFLVPYPLNQSPSQRFRFEQYFKFLTAEGHNFRVQSFLGRETWRLFYYRGNTIVKMASLAGGLLKRFFVLFRVPGFDIVFIHREAAPVGPPVFEWIIANVLRKKIIYDFDDAIWMTDRVNEPWLLKWVKWRSKVKSICRWSYRVSCGNEYLCDFARLTNREVIYNPTTIEMNDLNKAENATDSLSTEVVIGWTGSHSTLKYLREIEEPLKVIAQKFSNARFLVIADRPPEVSIPSMTFIAWSHETETGDLSKIDIGVMPLPDDEWTKGKCGLKILQYLSIGIPAVISPVGVGPKILEHGVTGYHCKNSKDWVQYLGELIQNEEQRRLMGTKGRKIVTDQFSVDSNRSNFLRLFA